MLSILLYLILLGGLVWWVETPHRSFANPLNLKLSPAEELENWLKRFNWGNRSEIKETLKLPSYKFYGEVVELLLALARRMGGSYQDSILFLREGLQSDRQFEKKLKEILLGTWLQMLLMVGLTWAFITGALCLVDVKIGWPKLSLILFWQLIGLSALPFTLKRYREHYFGDIGKLWKMLYVLRALAKVPLSRSEIMVMAGVQDLKHIHQKTLSHIVDKLKETCEKSLKQGGSYELEVHSLMEELRFQEKWHFELFEKRLTVVKLGLLSIFFLPSYLAFMFLLLGDLLALM